MRTGAVPLPGPDVPPGVNLVVEVTAPGQTLTEPIKLVLLPASTVARVE